MNFTATSTTDSPLLAACNDAAFGPGVSSAACRGGFDFTLAFEQYLFGIAPSATLLLAAPLRLAYLFSWKQQKKGPHGVDGGAQSGKKDRRSTATPVIVTGGRTLQLAKVVGFGILAVLQLAEAGLCGSWDGGGGDGGYGAWRTLRAALVAAAVLGALASIAGMVLSHVEHGRAARPSTVINAYLLVSVLVDAAVLRTLWLLRDQQQQSGMVPTTTSDITRRIVGAVAAVHSAAFAARVTLLVLEAVEKGRFLAPSGPVVRSPEETSGLIGRGLVWWMMGLLRTGYRRVLAPDDLYPVDESMSSKALSYRFSAVWETNGRSTIRPSLPAHWTVQAFTASERMARRTAEYRPQFISVSSTLLTVNIASSPRKHKLIRACAVTLRWAIAGVVLPRLCLLAFTICQPLLLDRFLNFLQDEEQSVNIGYGLVGAYAIVYIGIAVFGSLYWHQSYRTTTMLRGILMTAVFDKTLTISNTAAVDNDAAVTLMSTDVGCCWFAEPKL